MDKVKELVDSFNGEIYDLCYELLDGANDATIFEFVCNYFCERAKEKRITIKYYHIIEVFFFACCNATTACLNKSFFIGI